MAPTARRAWRWPQLLFILALTPAGGCGVLLMPEGMLSVGDNITGALFAPQCGSGIDCPPGLTGFCCEKICENMCLNNGTSGPNCINTWSANGTGECDCQPGFFGVLCENNYDKVALQGAAIAEKHREKGQVPASIRIMMFFSVVAFFLFVLFLWVFHVYRLLRDTPVDHLLDKDVDKEEEDEAPESHASQATAAWEGGPAPEEPAPADIPTTARRTHFAAEEDAYIQPEPPPGTVNKGHLLWSDDPWGNNSNTDEVQVDPADYVVTLAAVVALKVTEDSYATQTDPMMFADWVICRYGGCLNTHHTVDEIDAHPLSAQDVLFVLHFHSMAYELAQRTITGRVDSLSFNSERFSNPARTPRSNLDRERHGGTPAGASVVGQEDEGAADPQEGQPPPNMDTPSVRAVYPISPKRISQKSPKLTNPLVPSSDAS